MISYLQPVGNTRDFPYFLAEQMASIHSIRVTRASFYAFYEFCGRDIFLWMFDINILKVLPSTRHLL